MIYDTQNKPIVSKFQGSLESVTRRYFDPLIREALNTRWIILYGANGKVERFTITKN